MGNVWLDSNKKLVENLKRQLLEYSYKGSYGGEIPLMDIRRLLQSAEMEINRLQKENDDLRAKK